MSRAHVPPADGEGVYVSGRAHRTLASADVLNPGMRRRRAFTLVLLTLVVPGSAQIVAGNRRLGRVALRGWLTLLALGLACGVVALVRRSLVLQLFTGGAVLAVLEWALLGAAVFWAVLFVDAWRLARPRTLLGTTRRWLAVITACLLVVTSGGLVAAASNVAAGRDALNALFSGAAAADATDGRYNLLILGGDSGADRVGTRPDSIQLVSVDARTGRAVTFGFSRDTENINFRPGSTMHRLMPQGWNCGDQCLLNGLYTWGQEHSALFPPGTKNPGVVATREAVEALSGLTVHYYVMVDLRGFSSLINALGGLTVDVQKRTPIGGGTSRVSSWIEPGVQHLDGYHALWYARSRHGSTNYERMARQRCVMAAMLQQVDPQAVVLHFADIAAATKGVLVTDLPQSELGRFADLALKTRAQKIKSVNFVPPLIKPWDYDPAVVRSTVAATIRSSEGAAATTPSPVRRASTPAPVSGAAGAGAAGGTGTAAGAGRPAVAAPPSADSRTADLSKVCSAG